ncbi:hypothetical protein [Pseudoxanthomonas sp.]|uniref:hypothetical protein n=1 Tax=Pseudoxanthomonas sp. TaxID=1871049 RepID=UPI0028C49100|nr:hypothetical protein [Pseudoxanthomonas sp.]
MQRLNIVDVYGRGLADFTSLTPLERDVFVVHDLNLYYEMEGGFEDYILGGAHTEQLAWLSDTLLRVKDADSAVVLRELMALSEDKRDLMAPLCDRFYDLMESRWAAVDQYLYQQGAAVAW